MRRFQIRPVTITLVAVAAVFLSCAVMYFTHCAADLPGFFPGHQAHSTTYQLKTGIATMSVAEVALLGAWFTVSPALRARRV